MRQARPSDVRWSTANEITFIRKLGSHVNPLYYPYNSAKVSRMTLLNGYIEGAKLRDDWGHINSKACIAYAKNELLRLKEEG